MGLACQILTWCKICQGKNFFTIGMRVRCAKPRYRLGLRPCPEIQRYDQEETWAGPSCQCAQAATRAFHANERLVRKGHQVEQLQKLGDSKELSHATSQLQAIETEIQVSTGHL